MTDVSPRFRPVLDTVPAYQPGKAPTGAEGQEGHKLSSNESPYGPLPSVLRVIAEAAGDIHRYPDNGAGALTAAIAERFAVPVGHVAVGCGSVGVVKQLMEAVSDPGTEIIYGWRSFEAYPLLADLAGATSVRVPLRAETHDLEAMAAAITPRTRMILVCNPNNPTGTAVRERELIDFIDQVPADCLVVLDEAYHEYVRDPSVPDGIDLYRDRPNVAVLRTFSKAYGLAGLRVGFLVGHEPVTEAARKTMLTFAVSSVAQAAAVASLNAEDELLERVENVVNERHRVSKALRADGWTVPETEANFVWLPLGDRTAAFAQACDAAGIAVRPFAGEGARASIGTPAANDAFLTVAHAFRCRSEGAMAKGAILSRLQSGLSPGGTTPRTPRCGLRPRK
jgi:histidinol-phosphate aminotransferase